MELIKASEVKRKQMYSDSDIAEKISSAMHSRICKAYVNIELVEPEQITKLKELGYSLYNSGGKLEISWEYAEYDG